MLLVETLVMLPTEQSVPLLQSAEFRGKTASQDKHRWEQSEAEIFNLILEVAILEGLCLEVMAVQLHKLIET